MIYLIKNDNTYETYSNVIEWSEQYVVYKSGKCICKIYASEGEHFTNVEPVEQQ